MLTNVGFDADATVVVTDPNAAVQSLTAAQILSAATTAFTDATFWALPFTTAVAPL